MPEEVDALATTGRDGVKVLVWRHADDQYATDPRATAVTVRLEHLPFGGSAGVSHWRIDGAHSNSHTVWRALGAPQDPSEATCAAIQARQELERFEPDQTVAVRDGVLTLRLALPLPSVSLLEIRAAVS
jgi:xylan 1,4-beta-xylosidase